MQRPNEVAAITPEAFRRIRAVFESALALSESQRSDYVSCACGGNESMIAEVRRMLDADEGEIPILDGISQRGGRLQPGEIFAGHYVVEELLGRGGMGEVYRSRDSVLGRKVALKVLLNARGNDRTSLARLRREAQMLASLNHPNIAAIYSTEESNGVCALALELVEGTTLADRIARGPLPIEEALPIARQIADALEAAHEAGIIHRDLKPANIKLRPDGTVKVLDFGLAKDRRAADAIEREGGDIADCGVPDGRMLLGTPAYMAPEQARGDQVDKRADIWAFGVVLFEMLSAEPPFGGDSASEILDAVVRSEINWSKLPAAAPTEVRKLIARCLHRDVRRRLRDIGEARIVFEDAQSPPETKKRPRRAGHLFAAIFAAALLIISAIALNRPERRPVTRLSILLRDGQTLFPNRSSMAVSPDGRQIVYRTSAGLRLRNLSALESAPIRGTEKFFNITEPAFSPDGRWLVFHTSSDQTLKKVPVDGGTALKVCDAVTPSSVTWGPEGILFIEPGNAQVPSVRTGEDRSRDGILLVSPESGMPKHLVRLRNREIAHGAQLLPGGRHLLFTLAEWNSSDPWNDARIVIQDLTTGERKTILHGGSDARYLPTGHLVYANAGTLFAAPFDLRRLTVNGTTVPVLEGVLRAAPESTGRAHYTIASNGALFYLPGPVIPAAEIAVSDRKGRRETLPLPPRKYETPRISPNGLQIAFGMSDAERSDIFVYDLSGRTAMRRLTLQGNNRLPTWSPDGTRIAFQSDREGDRAIFWQLADGSGSAERLTTAANDESHEPESWSPKENVLLFSVRRRSRLTLSLLSVESGKTAPFGDVHSSTLPGATFSPNGRWVAYASTEAGRTTIYVQPFPPTGAKYQFVYEDDGKPNHPQWSHDGTELFFNPGPEQFKSVPVAIRPTFSFGKSVSLPRPFGPANTSKPRAYDILPDGRFIGVVGEGVASGQIVVVLDWFAELQSRVPSVR